MSTAKDTDRIREGLRLAGTILRTYAHRGVSVDRKQGGDPITEADLAVDRALRDLLPRPGEGWLSEETADDPARLACRSVWVVDPIDGTKEFIAGIPEWSVSIGLVRDGEPVAGGVYNPATDQMVVGALGSGVFLNGERVTLTNRRRLEGAVVLGSRSEVDRGEWERFRNGPFILRATGSVAFKLALLAAGLCDATWTLVPKSEWDVAAGVALVRSAGGEVCTPDWNRPLFNRRTPKLPGLVAANARLLEEIRKHLENGRRSPEHES